jgi:heme-degrading monooxygenase HmoA
MSLNINLPPLPYYAVIFTSLRTNADTGYESMAQYMVELASRQHGFLGVESARQDVGITVSYWADLESISAWKTVFDHQVAQDKGIREWYENFTVRICLVERQYAFERTNDGKDAAEKSSCFLI